MFSFDSQDLKLLTEACQPEGGLRSVQWPRAPYRGRWWPSNLTREGADESSRRREVLWCKETEPTAPASRREKYGYLVLEDRAIAYYWMYGS